MEDKNIDVWFYGFFLNEKNVYVKDTFHVFLTYKLILLKAPSNL